MKTWISKYNYFEEEQLHSKPLHEKGAVLSFFRSMKPTAAAGGRFSDIKTGETINTDWFSYSSDIYSWSTSDIYHFEKYDLELKPEFVEYALAHLPKA